MSERSHQDGKISAKFLENAKVGGGIGVLTGIFAVLGVSVAYAWGDHSDALLLHQQVSKILLGIGFMYVAFGVGMLIGILVAVLQHYIPQRSHSFELIPRVLIKVDIRNLLRSVLHHIKLVID
jgi:hypothetical protein